MFDPNRDGIDHINIYSKGKTELGRLMSNFTRLPMNIDGKTFESLEGYWYWLSTGKKHDNLCKLYGFQAKQVGKTYPRVKIDNFEQLIKNALRQKAKNSRVSNLLKASTLPFMHYYVYNGRVVDGGCCWIVEEWEMIRKELNTCVVH